MRAYSTFKDEIVKIGFLVLLVSLIYTNCAWGISSHLNLSAGKKQTMGTKKFYFHPYKEENLHTSNLQLFSLNELSFPEQIHQYLVETGLPKAYSLKLERKKNSSYDQHKISYFTFQWNKIDLCLANITAHEYETKQPIIHGNIPQLDPTLEIEQIPWPNTAETLQFLKSTLPKSMVPTIKLVEKNLCLFETKTNLLPVWNFLVKTAGGFFRIYLNSDKIFANYSQTFHILGQIQSYTTNPLDSVLTVDEIEFIGDTFLTTEKVITKPNGISRASSPEHSFLVDPDDQHFPEINAFGQLNRAISWFEGLGFLWNEGEILTIKTNQIFKDENGNESKNNALYQPVETKYAEENPEPDAPAILLGKGDGIHLRNLDLDLDAVAHEFAHHVIFQHLKYTSLIEHEDFDQQEHSGPIHEGLADYFVFAMTGNTCLGESICPGTTSAENINYVDVCYQTGKCLRNGNNTIIYKTESYTRFGESIHMKGQLISGLFWDIRSDNDVEARTFDTLALQSIEFLNPRSSYKDLLTALLSSDFNLHQGKYACIISEHAENRGFSDEIAAVVPDCTKFQLPDEVDPPISEPEVGSKKKIENGEPPKIFCSIIGPSGKIPNSSLKYLMLLLVMPLVSLIFIRLRSS